MLLAGTCLGLSAAHGFPHGFLVLVGFAVLAAANLALVPCVLKRWRKNSWASRLPAALLGCLLLVLNLVALLNLSINPSLIRTRQIVSLQREIYGDKRFDQLSLAYIELKLEFLEVSGNLENESDFLVLKQKIASRNWYGIDGVKWILSFDDSSTMLDQFDSDVLLRE